jgi:putative drug exporter of the RND superfamily
VLIPFVLAAVFIVIALLLRALVAPLVLVASAALSFGTSFGLSALVWRYGLDYSGVEAQLPTCIFVFLVALRADYNAFPVRPARPRAARDGRLAIAMVSASWAR